MSEREKMKCPKCNGELEAGFIPGIGTLVGGISVWVNKSAYSKVLPFIRPKKRILTYRCTQCGFLESYAE